MGGGVILMAILLNFLPVGEAMVIHGIVQLVSTGTRIILYNAHIKKELLLKYIIGVIITVIIFKLINFYPSKAFMYLCLGLMPFLGLTKKIGRLLSITDPGRSFLCGIIVTTAQLAAGVAGPILDVFFINAPLSRFEILGSKAITQAIGHIVKIAFYGTIMISTHQEMMLPTWAYAPIIVLTLIGNFFGAKIVGRMNDSQFKKISRYLIYLICIPLIIKGIRLL